MDIAGRVAVITGASRGLGAGMAKVFASHGVKLGLCARGPSTLADSAGVVTETLDVVAEAAVDAFAARVARELGHIDLWINNAGVLEPIAPLREIESEAFRRALDINVLGVFHGTRAFVRHLRASQRPGVLVNISSGAARRGYAGWSAYCATKAAVDLLTDSVQVEEAEAGLLRAHAVAPGVIDTDMQALIRSTSKDLFPEVDKFLQMKEDDAFSSVEFVADHMLRLAFDPAYAHDEVIVRFPPEKPIQ